jgi:hypothetical protein
MAERRTNRVVALLLVSLAIAVAGGLIALRLHFQPPFVPQYVAVHTTAEAQPVARRGTFRVELRPAVPVDGAVGARGFLLRGDEVRPWDPPFDVTRTGIVTIEGPAETLFAGVPSGPWEVAAAVGRPEVLPTAPHDVLRERSRDGGTEAGWRLVIVPIRLEAEAP